MPNRAKEFLKESNAIEEVYDDLSLERSVRAWFYLLDFDSLSPALIKQTHKLLMIGQPIHDFERGYWRQQRIWIGNNLVPWEFIPQAMDEWVKDAMTSVKVPGPDGHHIKLDHISFERIHPFIDGNGRMGRLLMNWQRVKAKLPILVIKESEKADYYEWFK